MLENKPAAPAVNTDKSARAVNHLEENVATEQSSLLTVEEAAQFLRIDTKTVYRLIDQNELKAALIGRVYRIERKDLMEFIQKAKIKVQKAPKKKY